MHEEHATTSMDSNDCEAMGRYSDRIYAIWYSSVSGNLVWETVRVDRIDMASVAIIAVTRIIGYVTMVDNIGEIMISGDSSNADKSRVSEDTHVECAIDTDRTVPRAESTESPVGSNIGSPKMRVNRSREVSWSSRIEIDPNGTTITPVASGSNSDNWVRINSKDGYRDVMVPGTLNSGYLDPSINQITYSTRSFLQM